MRMAMEDGMKITITEDLIQSVVVERKYVKSELIMNCRKHNPDGDWSDGEIKNLQDYQAAGVELYCMGCKSDFNATDQIEFVFPAHEI